jgi:hypothetical protein
MTGAHPIAISGLASNAQYALGCAPAAHRFVKFPALNSFCQRASFQALH